MEEVVVEVEGLNLSISRISSCHHIPSSRISRPIKRSSSSPTPRRTASMPSMDTEGGATKVGSRDAGITMVTARTVAGTSSTDSRASGTPKRQTA